MRSCQRESRSRVIKLPVGPGHRVMTLLASSRETCMRDRRRGCIEVVLMATHARGVGDVVVVVDMAIRALPRRNGMCSCQRETGGGVIKRCRLPCRGIVAGLASLRESAGYVVRVGGVLEISQVTSHACGARQAVIVVDVAICALARRNSMRSCQRKARRAVVECRIGPSARGVALSTSLRETGGHMVRVRGALEVLEVTRNAGCIRQVVVVINVAIRALAWWNGMSSCQREAGRVVVKRRIGPGAGGMALRTGLRKI